MRTTIIIACAALFVALAAHPAALEAQSGEGAPALGARFGYDFDDRTPSVGGHARVPFGPVYLVPHGDVFIDGDDRHWQAGLDATAPVSRRAYVGGGISAVNLQGSDDNGAETGYNLLAGLELGQVQRSSARPFVEGRATFLEDDVRYHLVLGVNAYFGGGDGRSGRGRGRR